MSVPVDITPNTTSGAGLNPKSRQPPNVPTATDSKVLASESGKPVPLVYGTAKLGGNLLERAAPITVGPQTSPTWHPSATYYVGQLVFGIQGSWEFYLCTIQGVSASSGGPHTATIGAEVIDGTVHWVRVSAGYHQPTLAIGLCEGPIAGLSQIWQDKQVYPNLGSVPHDASWIALLVGTQPQTRPGWAVSYADTYANVALFFLAQPVGSSNQQPNFSFEVQGLFATVPDGTWAPAWLPSTNYVAGAMVQNGGNLYACITGGTSASSGGPTGTGSSITDGLAQAQGTIQAACAWQYLSAYSTGANPWLDANPCDIAIDLLTHVRRGAGEPTTRIDPVSTGGYANSYRTYCIAAGLDLSWAVETQQAALDLLLQLLDATNTDCVWSGGQFKFVPLGSQAISANGASYAPTTAPVYDLGPDDILEPIKVQRSSSTDVLNSWPVEYVNRAQGYTRQVVDDPDMADVDRRGLRRNSVTSFPMVMAPASAIMCSRILAQRAVYVRNTYTVVVNRRFILLEPTDVITISDPLMGISRLPVRIVEWEETIDPGTSKSTITLVCEDWPIGVAAAAQYTPQAGDGYRPNAPDPINGLTNVTGGQLAPATVTGSNLQPNIPWTVLPFDSSNPTFGNWTGNGNVSYMVDGYGNVHLRGSVSATVLTAGPPLMNLPLGARPSAMLNMIVSKTNGGTASLDHVTIYPGGGLVFWNGGNAGDTIFFDGLVFAAA